MAPPSRRRSSAAAAGGSGKKRARSKLAVDLSGHGGRYEDAVDNDDGTPTLLHDEDVESDDDLDDDDGMRDASEEESEEEETVDDKRLRLAREYLNNMKAQESASSDDGESDDDEYVGGEDKVGKRIAEERLRKSGLLQTPVADSILQGVRTLHGNLASTIAIDATPEACAKSWLDAKYVTYHRGHDLTPTCVALSSNGHTAFSGAKDGSLIMWNVEEGKKTSCLLPAIKGGGDAQNRNSREILAVATSDDDRYLAVGGRDNCVRIFDVRTSLKRASTTAASPVATLAGHKGAVTSLAFRSRTLDLYSGSEDRCVRRYDLGSMTYVETLYGHQSAVIGVDCAAKSRPVTASRDRTVRVWKVEEDSHLVFRPGGGVGAAECVSAVRDGWFATGHDDGRLALWKEEKKRPVGSMIVAAHGKEGSVARGVACCAALGRSDVLATGSNDGHLRLWRVNTEDKRAGIEPLDAVPIHGHVNGIAVGPGGKFCVAAVGQEPRLGRWDRVPRAKNRLAIVRLNGGDGSRSDGGSGDGE